MKNLVAIIVMILVMLSIGCQSEIKKAKKEVEQTLKALGTGTTGDEVTDKQVKLLLCKSYQKLGNAYLGKKLFQEAKSTYLLSLQCFDNTLSELDYEYHGKSSEELSSELGILTQRYIALRESGIDASATFQALKEAERALKQRIAELEAQVADTLAMSLLTASKVSLAKEAYQSSYLSLLDSLTKCYTSLLSDNTAEEFSHINKKRKRTVDRIQVYEEKLPELKKKEIDEAKKRELEVLKK